MLFDLKEEKLRGRPGYEHLNDPLHILIEADLPANVVDIRLRQAQEIIEELLKPVVHSSSSFLIKILYIHLKIAKKLRENHVKIENNHHKNHKIKKTRASTNYDFGQEVSRSRIKLHSIVVSSRFLP